METQQTISAWAAETFPRPATDLRIATRANSELAELLASLTTESETLSKASEEAADVAIVLLRLLDRIQGQYLIRDSHIGVPYSALDHAIAAHVSLNRTMINVRAMVRDVLKRGEACFWIGKTLEDLAYCCKALGSGLQVEIDAKMAINRTRKWDPETSQHLED